MNETKHIPFGRPWITDEDRNAVLEVLHGHILTHGPKCKEFEQQFSSFLGPEAHSISVSSCTAALHLAYLHFGIGPGDEVIVPAQTHVATIHAVEFVGATPVFADCDPSTGNITPQTITPLLTRKTRAISVVHFVGIPCDMPEITEIAEAHNLKVIEDCALALGSRLGGKHTGLFGDVGCFSFYPVKHITTGEGGMFVTKNPDTAQSVNRLRAFCVDRTHSERSIPGHYDVLGVGYNYRMSEMQAALGCTQMMKVDAILQKRRENFQRLKSGLKEIPHVRVIDATNPAAVSSYYCACMFLEGDLSSKRNELVAFLNRAGVGTSIYYPQPVPYMTYYHNKYGCPHEEYPNAQAISYHSIALPVGPHVQEEDIEYIVQVVHAAIEEVRQ